MSLLWPSRRFVGRGNPQSVVAAPLGATYLDEANGALYQKLAGQSTTGWYLAPSVRNPRWHVWSALEDTGTASGLIGVPKGAGSWDPASFAACQQAINQPVGKHYSGGYAQNVIGNSLGWRLTSLQQSGPQIFKGADFATLTPYIDSFWDILTTPQPTGAAASTNLTNVRILIGFIGSGATITTNATLANSDDLRTAFAGSWGLGAGQFGVAVRFSTAAADPGFVLVTANDNGAATAQSVSSLISGGLLVANTVYRVRIRFDPVTNPAVPRVHASINDGPETVATVNVGPGSGFVTNNRFYQPYCFLTNLEAVNLKSLALNEYYSTWGLPT